MKKKLFALVLTLAMCLGLAVPAFATPLSDAEWEQLYGGKHTSGNWTYTINRDGTATLGQSTVNSATVSNETLTLPATLDGYQVTGVDMYAFSCNSPKMDMFSFNKLVIPEGYTTLGGYAFESLALTEISLPSTLTTIGTACFKDLQAKSVELPASLTLVENWAFASRYLETVTVRGKDLDVSSGLNEFISSSVDPSLKTIRCLGGSKAEAFAVEKGLTVEYLDGAPAAGLFTDVPSNQYYYQPVLWAVENGITAGTTPTTFSPDQTCTRAQILTFLWRAAGSPYYGLCDQFTDVKDSDYFAQAVGWAFKAGIIKANYAGASETSFFPDAPCTRAAAVQFIWGAKDFHNYDDLAHNFSFTDVTSDAEYYSAVVWAVLQGVTSGTSATTFSPDQTCTRAQIMTFLYKAFGA